LQNTSNTSKFTFKTQKVKFHGVGELLPVVF
jgi:hypothetical protein